MSCSSSSSKSKNPDDCEPAARTKIRPAGSSHVPEHMPLSPAPHRPLGPRDIAAALRRPLPGFAAQGRMAIRPRPGGFTPPEGVVPRESAVLVLLYPRGGELTVALIHRADDGGSHSGQVSFPGGGQDPGETLEQTALREAREEVGLDPAAVTILGALTPLYVPVSQNRIHPLVAYAPSRPDFVRDPREVQEIIEEPLAYFLDESSAVEETWHFGTYPVQVPFFPVGRHKLWGATAMVLSELAAAIKNRRK